MTTTTTTTSTTSDHGLRFAFVRRGTLSLFLPTFSVTVLGLVGGAASSAAVCRRRLITIPRAREEHYGSIESEGALRRRRAAPPYEV